MAGEPIDLGDENAIRAALSARRAELQALIESSAESRAVVQLDQSQVGRLSRVDAMQGQQMALATDRRRTLELARIEAALARLDAGEYGACARCGEDIAPRRLASDPAVALCVDCAGAA